MLNVTMDTSILRTNPPRSRKEIYKPIKKLIDNKKIKLYLPEMVIEEFLSHKIKNEIQPEINNIKKGIESLTRKPFSEEIITKINEIYNEIEEEILISNYKKEFINWFQNFNGVMYELKNEHTKPVFNKYFTGDPPFSKIKHKEDIPDAFIFEAFKDISEKVDHLHIIIDDNTFENALSSELKDVSIHKSLDTFIQLEEFQKHLTQYNIKDSLFDLIDELENDKSFMNKVFSDKLVGGELEINNLNRYITCEENKVFIRGIGEIEDLYFKNKTYLGEGTALIPFFTNIEVFFDFYIFKKDFYLLSEEEKQKVSISEWNEYYYSAQMEQSLNIEGILTVNIPTESTHDLKTYDEIYDFLDIDKNIILYKLKEIYIPENNTFYNERKKHYDDPADAF